MRQFIAFIRKEFFHIFRDRRTVLIVLGMPVVEIILFGFAITTEVKNARVAVYDPSQDVTTQRIISRLDASDYFSVERMLSGPGEIEQVLREGKAELVVVFGERFEENRLHGGDASVQLIADASDPNTAATITGYAQGVLASFQDELSAASGGTPGIVPVVRMLYNPQMKGAYNFVPGVMGMILMLICAMMTAVSIVREKEMGTMEVLLVSPIRPICIILAKAVPYLVLSCANLATILLLSVYVLGVPVAGSLLGLALISLLFIMVSLALGLLISTLTTTQVAAMLVSGMTLMMPVVMLSGMIFPLESMPWPLQWVSHVLPAKWYIMAVRKMMIEGLGMGAVLKEFGILLLMAVGLVAISLKKFKNRLA